MSMFCTKCGFQLADDSRFCARCGTALTPLADAPQQPPSGQSAGNYPPAYSAPPVQQYAPRYTTPATTAYGSPASGEVISCPFCGSSSTFIQAAIGGGTRPFLNKRQCSSCLNTFRRISDIRMEQQTTENILNKYRTLMFVAAGILAVCAVLFFIMGSIQQMNRVLPFIIICGIVSVLALLSGLFLFPFSLQRCQNRLREEEAALRRAPYFKE